MKSVTIGDKILDVPIIQGGMGIGVSRERLAGAVAREGAMGVLSAAQIGYDRPDFLRAPEAANLDALPDCVARARELAEGRGLIGINIMAATQNYPAYVRAACAAGVDAIISGAGLPTNLPALVEGSDVAIAPIVSSAKSARVILKYWRKHGRIADFLVIEGPLAGGHLGFKGEQLTDIPALDFDAEIRAIIALVREEEASAGRRIPVFVAGGVTTADDVAYALALGADGVQVASRFVTTYECDAAQAYKDAYLAATDDDIVIVASPVGMPGRALNNAFVQRVAARSEPVRHCYNCLAACNPQTTPYCISAALINAVRGNIDDGLIFCGAHVGALNKMEHAADVIRDLNIRA
ncbi:MAG: nitronate monooxygenase family protein [Peptococcaceae bacterium]|nr:nitronate monooxygenase family protein [Peptococcaceae bacterium]